MQTHRSDWKIFVVILLMSIMLTGCNEEIENDRCYAVITGMYQEGDHWRTTLKSPTTTRVEIHDGKLGAIGDTLIFIEDNAWGHKAYTDFCDEDEVVLREQPTMR